MGIQGPTVSHDVNARPMKSPPCYGFHIRLWDAAVMALPFLLYGLTASRSLGTGDTTILMDGMLAPTLSSHVCNHNLTNLLGFVFAHCPWVPFFLRFHLVSVVCGGLAVALFYRLLLALETPRALAALGAGVWMVSHSLWWHSTIVENYALSMVFLIGSLLATARDAHRRLAGEPRRRGGLGLGFLAGLALFNHVQNGVLTLAAGAYAAWLRRRLRAPWSALGWMALGWLLGVLPYATLLLRDLLQSDDPAATWRWAIGGGFTRLMFDYQLRDALVQLGRWIVMQFPSPFLLLIGWGLIRMLRGARADAPSLAPSTPVRLYALAVMAINIAFFLGYKTWDQFAFYLPTFAVLALLGNDAARRLASQWPTVLGRVVLWTTLAFSVLAPPWVYARIGTWAVTGDGYWSRPYGPIARTYQARYDLVGYLTNPNRRHCDGIERFVRQTLAALPPNALLVDDASTFYQFDFLQRREGLRPDVELLLIQPLGITDWGTPADALARRLRATTRPVFFVTDVGPCGEMIGRVTRPGDRVAPFALDDKRHLFQLIRQQFTPHANNAMKPSCYGGLQPDRIL